MAIDITTGKFHNSAFKYISFREVGAAAGEQQLVSKDNTISQSFLLEKVVLGCQTGNVNIFDGSSSAVPIFGLNGGGQDITMGQNQQEWDFKGDPIELTRDSTSLCISGTGTFHGFIKWGWATKTQV